jgi:predicted pyridoxine 5'-phosphate oxidase superfamily flavin-nucleotide-binding protein
MCDGTRDALTTTQPSTRRKEAEVMAALPEDVTRAWDERKGPVAFATVDTEGIPNVVYASCVSKYDEATLVVADNFFHKTRANILATSKGSILFITNSGKSYQVKGALERLTSGPLFDDMKSWNGTRPGHAAVALRVEEAYAGAERLL